VTAVSDRATDALSLLFDTDRGREHLARRGIGQDVIGALGSFGLSSICNVLAAIKTARWYGLGADDVILTVATDGASLYATERERIQRERFPDGFDDVAAAEVFGRYLLATSTDHFLELTQPERDRIFNLGYFTWVEQRGVSVQDFEARRDQRFWRGLREVLPAWDEGIVRFNERTGALGAG
jgi:hypothetical protein